MKASINRKDGRPLGQLNAFSRNYSAMPQSPDGGDAAVPSFNATFAANEEVYDVDGEDVVLTTEYQAIEGTVNSVSAGSGTNLVTIDATHVASKLNSDRTALPIIRQGYAALPRAIYHWAQECGVFQYPTQGDVQFYIPAADSGSVGWANHGVGRPIARWNDMFGLPYWILNMGDTYPAMEVSDYQSVLIGVNFDRVPGGAKSVLYFERLGNSTQTRGRYMQIEIDGGNNVTVLEWLEHDTPTVMLQGNLNPQGSASAMYPVYILIKKNAAGTFDYSMSTPLSDFVTAPVTIKKTNTRSYIGQGVRLRGVSATPVKVRAVTGSFSDSLPTHVIPSQISVRVAATEPVGTTSALPDVIAGFQGNIWAKLKEACAIYDLNLDATSTGISIKPREFGAENITPRGKSGVRYSVDSREHAEKVEVVNQRLKVGYDKDILLWEAEQVYNLERGEVQEHTVQSGSTFLTLNQPRPVSSAPFPYTWDTSAYIVWDSDDNPVSPSWWTSYGGYITVEPTGKSGEFKLIIKAPAGPATYTTPFKIGTGRGDFPALYITGRGVSERPETLTIYTGADDPKQEVGVTFDSPLITNEIQAYNAGARLAKEYGGQGMNITYNEPFDGQTVRGLSTFNIAHDGNVYRITSLAQTHNNLSVNAESYNTVDEFDRIYGNMTLDDYAAIHKDKKLKSTELHPLPRYIS